MKLCEDHKSLARLATDAGSHRSSIWKLNSIDGRADRHVVTRIYHACCPSCGRYTGLEWPETYVLQSSGRTWSRHKKTSTFIMWCSPVTGQAHVFRRFHVCLPAAKLTTRNTFSCDFTELLFKYFRTDDCLQDSSKFFFLWVSPLWWRHTKWTITASRYSALLI